MWRKEGTKSGEQHAGMAPVDFANAPAGVSQGIRIKGEITGQGDFFVHGEIEGKISLGNGTLTVGPHSRVHAEIEARAVEIHGEVIGSLKACERVHVWGTGKLTGDIETRGIVIDDGAILHSKVAVAQTGEQKENLDRSLSGHAEPAQASVLEPLQRAKSTTV
jgi:cytoskeletal protein CcmA (bactofilin family)